MAAEHLDRMADELQEAIPLIDMQRALALAGTLETELGTREARRVTALLSQAARAGDDACETSNIVVYADGTDSGCPLCGG